MFTKIDIRSQRYRIRPALCYDYGLDPVHTPEGADIRQSPVDWGFSNTRVENSIVLRDIPIRTSRQLVVVYNVRIPYAG